MTATATLPVEVQDAPSALLDLLARAASPAERLRGGWLRPCGDPAVAEERLERWGRRVADGHPERIARVLLEHGLTLDQWRTGLGDVTAVPGATPPGWVQDARTLLDLVGTGPEPSPPPTLGQVVGDGLPAWADPDEPWRFHAGFRDWMAAGRRDVARWAAAAPVSSEVQQELVLDLVRRQLAVAGPLLVAAAARRPTDDPLFAARPGEDWAVLWSTHPVLARLLGTTWRQWRTTTAELCRRITADLPAICPGVRVDRVELSAGDQHDGGRRVVRLHLSDQTSVFLKPRSDGLQHLFAAVLAQLDAVGPPLGLRGPVVLERDGYAWSREVRAGDCVDDDAVDAYFWRAGALLRLAQALGSTDLHHENFVPTPDLPVLVDLETLVGPGSLRSAPPPDVVSVRLGDTPGPTSMVTSVVAGAPGRRTADIGALAGPATALTPYTVPALVQEEDGAAVRGRRIPLPNGTALPRRTGRAVALRGHEPALVAGYAEVHRRLRALAGTDLVPALDPEPLVRFVARPTRTYARLLLESTAPDALVDGVERELVLERLYRATGTAPAGLIPCEVEALRELDVPLFGVPFTRTDLLGDGATVLPDVVTEAPRDRTRRRLSTAGTRTDHVDDLTATLFAADPHEGAGTEVAATPGSDRAAGPGDPVELLLHRAVEVEDGTLEWIGLEHDPNRHRWTYGRMGAGLTGQAGIGLALATVAARAADPPAGCAAAARAALLGSVERAGRGLGATDAFGGPAGVLYAAAVAARLLDDGVLLEAARSLVLPCLRAARRGDPSWVVDGAAGGVLALLHLPADDLVADALTELDALAGAVVELDRPDPWSTSLPSRAAGAALAAQRLAAVRGHRTRTPSPPDATTAGDRIASATVQPPPGPPGPVPSGAGLRTLVDEAVLAQAALGRGPDRAWATRREHVVALLRGRRTRDGRWCAPLLAPDPTFLSPVHGMAALATLVVDLGPGVPIARALT